MKYYVYTLSYPNGSIFYIGKGVGNRIEHHEINALNGEKNRKSDIIRSIISSGNEILKKVVFESDIENDVLKKEYELIVNFSDKSQLSNVVYNSNYYEKHGKEELSKLDKCQCTVCGLIFKNIKYFDKHKIYDRKLNKRRCLTPNEIIDKDIPFKRYW